MNGKTYGDHVRAELRQRRADAIEREPDPALSARLLRGRLEGARSGKHQSGPAPYGYERDRGRFLVVCEREAELVRFMFRVYPKVRSLRRLAEMLAKWRTRQGKRWSRAGIAWILGNETYLGKVHFGPVRVAEGTHDALVSPIVFNVVQALRRKLDKHRARAARPRGRGKDGAVRSDPGGLDGGRGAEAEAGSLGALDGASDHAR